MRRVSKVTGALACGAAAVCAAQPRPRPIEAPRSAPAPRGFHPAPPAAIASRATDDQITFSVTFDDPTGSFAGFTTQIRSAMLAAGAAWARVLSGSGSIEIVVRPGDIATANGGSVTSGFVYNNGAYDVLEQGMETELRTGVDPNGSDPDVGITIGLDYLANELWFDPDPVNRSGPIPIDRTDAISIFTHELGHAIGFNGWRDEFNWTLPGDYESTYDEPITFDGDFHFPGPRAVSVYGSPVPLTFGSYPHLGNSPPRPGSDLIPDLMNGVVVYRGVRYYPSAVDVAILADAGVLIQQPCYANCDGSTSPPILNVNDFICFQTRFAAGSSDANCDGSTTLPVLNVNDFICFQQRFAAGCN